MTDTILSPLIAASAPQGFLIVESGSLAGRRFPLPPAPGALLLGRERICNVRFDPEQDRVVGRNHARIEVRVDGIYLLDLNSANGTFRGDGSVVRGELRLSSGDRFQLGGEGGPWLSLQTADTRVAVHVAPPASEMPTLIIPAVALPATSAKSQPMPAAEPPASSAASQTAQVAASFRPPVIPPGPVPPGAFAPETSPLPGHETESVRRPQPAPVDPIALQQQTQYRRQIAAITLLLLLACSAGLALGLREGPVEDDVEASRSE